jgi:hypothetical protein
MGHAEIKERVRAVLLDNVMEGYSALLGAQYCYVMPSKERYQFQWFWDTCFHVFILCALGEVELARRNLRSLFRQQEDNGFVGHMIFWRQVLPNRMTDVLQARATLQSLRPHMSALVQPPLVAQALRRVYDVSEGAPRDNFQTACRCVSSRGERPLALRLATDRYRSGSRAIANAAALMPHAALGAKLSGLIELDELVQWLGRVN